MNSAQLSAIIIMFVERKTAMNSHVKQLLPVRKNAFEFYIRLKDITLLPKVRVT